MILAYTAQHGADALRAVHTAASLVLAASDDTDNEGGENQKAGPLGLAIILLLGVACYFLFRSMSRRLRRVRERFPEPAPPPRPRAPALGDDQDVPVQVITTAPEAASEPQTRPPD